MKPAFATVCTLICLLALTVGASAQATLNFADLPLMNTPSPMPSGYGQIDWGNFYYVDPFSWSGAGPGERLGPQGQDIAFLGSRTCRLVQYACFGTITDPRGFQLVSATIAGSQGPTAVTATAYNNGNFVGTTNLFITSQMRTVVFPANWGDGYRDRLSGQRLDQHTGALQPEPLYAWRISAGEHSVGAKTRHFAPALSRGSDMGTCMSQRSDAATSEGLNQAQSPAPLGPLESQVIEVLWSAGECTVREVMKRLPTRSAYTTVMTTLVRLFRKGLLERRSVERKFLYSPRMTREQLQRRIATDAAARFLATPNVSRAMLADCLWRTLLQNDPGLLAELERLIQRRRWEQEYLNVMGRH